MTKQTKEVATRDPIYELLSSYKTAIKNVLPKHLTAERVLRVAYTAIHRTPGLRTCSRDSLINAVLEISMLGLDIGRTAHIIPFGKVATFICDYKGFIDLAHRSERIEAFTFKPVYENDHFEYREGTSRHIDHKPFRGEDRGALTAAYSIVFFKHGGYDFEVVEAPDIAATKRSSPGAKKSDSPWNKPDQEWTMWCKTAVRRLAKRVPQSPELQRAAYLEELAEAGLRQDINHIGDMIDIEPIPESAEETPVISFALDAAFDKAAGGLITDPLLPEWIKVCAKSNEMTVAQAKEGAIDDMVAFKHAFNTWKQAKLHGQTTGHAPEDFRNEWIKKKTAGFATYVHKNLERFDEASEELQAEAKAKWQGLYPDDAWPLDEPKETEEEKKRREMIDRAAHDIRNKITGYGNDIYEKALEECAFDKPSDRLEMSDLEAWLKKCGELSDDDDSADLDIYQSDEWNELALFHEKHPEEYLKVVSVDKIGPYFDNPSTTYTDKSAWIKEAISRIDVLVDKNGKEDE